MMARRDPGVLPTTVLRHLANGSCQTIEQMETSLGLSRRQLSDGAMKLAARKYLLRMARGCYQLSEAGLAAALAGEVITSGPKGPDTAHVRKPFKDTFRERAWRAMRVRRHFTISDIVADAAADGESGEDNARRYINALISAGFVQSASWKLKGTRPTCPGIKLYRLVKDTGPRAPVYRPKLHAVHDYNTGEDVACKSN